MTLIGYETMDKEMRDMVTVVVPQVGVLLVMFVVVFLEEVEARWCAITIIKQDI